MTNKEIRELNDKIRMKANQTGRHVCLNDEECKELQRRLKEYLSKD